MLAEEELSSTNDNDEDVEVMSHLYSDGCPVGYVPIMKTDHINPQDMESLSKMHH